MPTDHGDNPVLEAKQTNMFSINNIKYLLVINTKLQQQEQRLYEIDRTCTIITRDKS